MIPTTKHICPIDMIQNINVIVVLADLSHTEIIILEKKRSMLPTKLNTRTSLKLDIKILEEINHLYITILTIHLLAVFSKTFFFYIKFHQK